MLGLNTIQDKPYESHDRRQDLEDMFNGKGCGLGGRFLGS